jgi:hypothetical protein
MRCVAYFFRADTRTHAYIIIVADVVAHTPLLVVRCLRSRLAGVVGHVGCGEIRLIYLNGLASKVD